MRKLCQSPLPARRRRAGGGLRGQRGGGRGLHSAELGRLTHRAAAASSSSSSFPCCCCCCRLSAGAEGGAGGVCGERGGRGGGAEPACGATMSQGSTSGQGRLGDTPPARRHPAAARCHRRGRKGGQPGREGGGGAQPSRAGGSAPGREGKKEGIKELRGGGRGSPPLAAAPGLLC